jgi:hypothetical protein
MSIEDEEEEEEEKKKESELLYLVGIYLLIAAHCP